MGVLGNIKKVAEDIKPSAQRFITRFHTTPIWNTPSIHKKGLQPREGGGFMDNLDEGEAGRIKGAFTTSRSPIFNESDGSKFRDTYFPYGTDVDNTFTLEFMIPKEEYLANPRVEFNPEVQFKGELPMDRIFNRGNLLTSVQGGGRTDIFTKPLNPNDLKAIWVQSAEGGPKRYNLEDFAMDPDACEKYDEQCDQIQEYFRNRLGLDD